MTFVVDPLQHFRKATWFLPEYSGHDAYYLPGLIKYYDYDTIIVGSSIIQNTSADQVGEIFHGRALKIGISAAHSPEMAQAMNLALGRGKTHTVVFTLEYTLFLGTDALMRTIWPAYSYDKNIWSDWPYLFNVANVWPSLVKTFFKNLKPADREQVQQRDWDELWSWAAIKALSKGRVLDNWRDYLHHAKPNLANYDLETWEKGFDTTIGPVIQQHPQVQFYICLPPYPILYWNIEYRLGILDAELAFKKALLERLITLPNVQVFDFQNERKLTWDLDKYYDLIHFDPSYSTFQMNQLQHDEYRVTREKIDSGIADLREQAVHCAVSGNELYWQP